MRCPRAADDLVIAPLLGRHRINDRLQPPNCFSSTSSRLLCNPANGPLRNLQMLSIRHLLDCRNCSENRSSEIASPKTPSWRTPLTSCGQSSIDLSPSANHVPMPRMRPTMRRDETGSKHPAIRPRDKLEWLAGYCRIETPRRRAHARPFCPAPRSQAERLWKSAAELTASWPHASR